MRDSAAVLTIYANSDVGYRKNGFEVLSLI